MGLWFPPVGKGEHPALTALQGSSQEAHSGLTSWGSVGKSIGLNHRQSDKDDEGGQTYRNQCSDLGRLHFCLELLLSRYPSHWLCPSVKPSQWPCLAKEFSWQSCLVWVPSQQPYQPWSSFYSPSGQGSRLKAHPVAEHNLWPCPNRSLTTDAHCKGTHLTVCLGR